ncbi:chitin deacetylase 1-like [Gigantopelta aegis]|uniref:chitin deacetylase 1-like n=1 Tax=Gigantopelta aegis TaxID=1735272 RepID=UPI001B88E38E|nr:chitin deacetylase 1-like [Gigantopelta aegis]
MFGVVVAAAAAAVVACTVVVVSGQDCIPGDNCKLPNCRCSNDPDIPGKLSRSDTPQMVLVTFEEAVNEDDVPLYESIFKQGNPNGCPPRGTFFVKHKSTDYEIVRALFDKGHEFGAESINGIVPTTEEEWRRNLKFVKDELIKAGLPAEDILGVRAPNLMAGGLKEFVALGDNKFLYDASCITSTFIEQGNTKWPYTYDFVDDVPKCNIGTTLDVKFPGKWQFLIPVLNYKNSTCAVPQGCTTVLTQRDAFDMFFDNFSKHYEGTRAPFVLVISADFVKTDFKLAGLTQFLEYVRAAFEDTWVVTARQALQWVQDPTSNANITDFGPWKC